MRFGSSLSQRCQMSLSFCCGGNLAREWTRLASTCQPGHRRRCIYRRVRHLGPARGAGTCRSSDVQWCVWTTVSPIMLDEHDSVFHLSSYYVRRNEFDNHATLRNGPEHRVSHPHLCRDDWVSEAEVQTADDQEDEFIECFSVPPARPYAR